MPNVIIGWPSDVNLQRRSAPLVISRLYDLNNWLGLLIYRILYDLYMLVNMSQVCGRVRLTMLMFDDWMLVITWGRVLWQHGHVDAVLPMLTLVF